MAQHKHTFSKFLDLCDRVTGHDEEVLKLIKKRHQRAKSDFIQSEDFLKLLRHTAELISKDVVNKYVHIKELLTELKAYQEQPSKPSRFSNSAAEVHSDSSARKRMFDSDTDSIPDLKRHHRDVCKNLDENSKDSNTSETTSERHRQNKNNHDTDSDSAASNGSHLVVNVGNSDATNGGSAVEKRKHYVSSEEGMPSKRCKQSDIEATETTVGNEGNGLGNEGSTAPSAARSTEGALDTDDMCQSREGADGPTAKTKGSERQIIKLEGLLKDISKRIKKLEEKDISLDDMENDSAYTLVERYKAKFVKVWDKLCSIKGRAPTTGRPTERRFHFEGTRYPEVNKRIERFINRHQIFPDFHDIYEIITRCNVKHCFHLGRKAIGVIARDAFIDVGNQLQKRRIRDFQSNFGCHLTECYRERNDPALYDRELHTKLDGNKAKWKSSLDEVINKFVKRQEFGEDTSGDEEEEEEEAASDEELLHEGTFEEVGKAETSRQMEEDKREKVGDEESGTRKLKEKKEEGEQVEMSKKEEEGREEDVKSSDVDDSCRKGTGKNLCEGSSMPDVEEEDNELLSCQASNAAGDAKVRNVAREVLKETSSSHLTTDGSTGSCNSGEYATRNDSDGNNQCDGNTNTREWRVTDDDSNSFNSNEMNIVECDYSNDSKKQDDIQTCYDLSSSSSSATPSTSEVENSSSDEGNNSRHKMKEYSPDPSRCKKTVTDFAGVLAEAFNVEKPQNVESRHEEKDGDVEEGITDHKNHTERNDSKSNIVLIGESEAPCQYIFSPSKLKITPNLFCMQKFPGLCNDAPIIIDQDDKTTSSMEQLPHNVDTSTVVATATSHRYTDHRHTNGEMNIKIKNYCSLSSDIVVKVTTPDSTTTSTECCLPNLGQRNSPDSSQQYPSQSMYLPVMPNDVIELLSDSE